jgi:hypothetical protein
MVNQARGGVASPERPTQGFDGEIAFQAITRRPADDPAREEVQHRALDLSRFGAVPLIT